jgi:diguanylate cyclase (GGDEF)-like protein
VTIIVADVNGLKATNDELGHLAGDGLLRRSGEVLGKLVDKPAHVARIGGDEFAILLPGTEEKEGEALVEKLQQLVDINNQFYPGPPLSFSIGIASSQPGERLESVVRRADMLMYEAKRAFYAAQSSPPAGSGLAPAAAQAWELLRATAKEDEARD